MDYSNIIRSTDFLYFYDQVCVWPLPKCGSNSIFYTHKKLSGYLVHYDLGPNFKINHHESNRKKLILHLRNPLDRFWAAVRQDFKWSKKKDFEQYLKKNIDTIVNLKEDHTYQDINYKKRLTNHSKEDIVFRIRRLLELTKGWYTNVYLESTDNLNESLCKNWNCKPNIAMNKGEDFLKQKISKFRKNNPNLDNAILKLPRIKKEQKLYECVGAQLDIKEFTKKIILISTKK